MHGGELADYLVSSSELASVCSYTIAYTLYGILTFETDEVVSECSSV